MQADVPQSGYGDMLFCHLCQRSLFFAGGLTQLLLRDVKMEVASHWHRKQRTPK